MNLNIPFLILSGIAIIISSSKNSLNDSLFEDYD
jgi:hypothetical protein